MTSTVVGRITGVYWGELAVGRGDGGRFEREGTMGRSGYEGAGVGNGKKKGKRRG